MSRFVKAYQILFLQAILLFVLFSSLGYASSRVDAVSPIQLCVVGGSCYPYTLLQDALDYANDHSTLAMTITLQSGVYTNATPTGTVWQKTWRNGSSDCALTEFGTTFLLEGRSASTFIQGATGNPADVVILGGLPTWSLTKPYSNVIHAFTLNNSSPVTLTNLTIASNGGRTANGIGDAVLNVVDSKGALVNGIIAANKTFENPLYVEWEVNHRSELLDIDLEGVHLYGPDTVFRIESSLIGGSFHTGVMVTENAQGWVIASLIRGNGWSNWDDEYLGKGHGVTSVAGEMFHGCYSENMQLKVWNSIIMRNSGDGLLIRGNFTDTVTGIVHNTVEKNDNYGIRLEALTLQIPGTGVFIANNLVLTNTLGGISIAADITSTQVSAIKIYNNSSSGHPANMNYDIPDDYAEQIANLEPTDPKINPLTFQLLPGSPLIGKGWGRSDPAPDISSYSYVNQPEYAFNEQTLDLWCKLYDALEQLGTPIYTDPCPVMEYLPLIQKD